MSALTFATTYSRSSLQPKRHGIPRWCAHFVTRTIAVTSSPGQRSTSATSASPDSQTNTLPTTRQRPRRRRRIIAPQRGQPSSPLLHHQLLNHHLQDRRRRHRQHRPRDAEERSAEEQRDHDRYRGEADLALHELRDEDVRLELLLGEIETRDHDAELPRAAECDRDAR